MMIVCPFNRPERLPRLLEMWRAQTIRAPLFLAGSNGGAWAEDARSHAIVETGHYTIGAAKNAGLAHARRHGVQWVAFWDDDNYYGPDYLYRIELAMQSRPLEPVDVVCCHLGFVRMGGSLWHFQRQIPFFPGHSTAVRVEASPDFPECSRGEDVVWSRSFASEPCAKWIGPWGLVYNREGNGHAYDAGQAEFLRTFGPGIDLGNQPDSFVDEPKTLPTGPKVYARDEDVFAELEARL